VSSNPIYVRAPRDPEQDAMPRPAGAGRPIFDGKSDAGWHVESDAHSRAVLEAAAIAGGGGHLRFRYALAGGAAAGQFVTLAYNTPNGTEPNDRLAFSVRAERPMRISVQLRAHGPTGIERWQRSVYVDTLDREGAVAFDDLTPIGVTRTLKPVLAEVRSVLFVIDTTNAKPGTSGRFWIRQASLRH
jgi:hypothetical protein